MKRPCLADWKSKGKKSPAQQQRCKCPPGQWGALWPIALLGSTQSLSCCLAPQWRDSLLLLPAQQRPDIHHWEIDHAEESISRSPDRSWPPNITILLIQGKRQNAICAGQRMGHQEKSRWGGYECLCKDIAMGFSMGHSAVGWTPRPSKAPSEGQLQCLHRFQEVSASLADCWAAAHSTWWGSFSQTRLWGRHTPFPVQLCCYEHIHPLFLEVQTLFKLRESGLRFVKAHTLLLILSSDPQLANDKPYIFGRTFGQNNGCYFTCPLSLILQIFWKHVPYPGLTGYDSDLIERQTSRGT